MNTDPIINIHHEVDPKEWNKNLLKNESSSTYQTSNWLTLYDDVYNSDSLYIYVEDKKGNILAQFGASVHDKHFWSDSNLISRKIGTSLHLRKNISWNYGPIIYDDEHRKEIIEKILIELEQFAIKNKIISISGIFTPLNLQPSSKTLEQNKYKIIPWATYNIKLNQPSSEFLKSYDKKTRYDIRKSEDQNLRLQIVDNKKDLQLFRMMKNKSRKIQNRRNIDDKLGIKYLNKAWDLLYKNNLEKMFLIFQDDELIAGMRAFTFNRNLIQFAVVNNPDQTNLGGTFLTWNVIKWAIENKFSNLDLGGINPQPSSSKEKQIDFYKSKWGGEQLPYTRCLKVFNESKMKLSSFLKNPSSISKKYKNKINTK